MKQRSLFKRLLSGFLATALATTVCLDGDLITALRASAVGEPQTVNVDFYDGGELSPAVNEDGDSTNYKYYVLGVLVDKDAGPKVAATADYVDQFVAWDCKEITPKADAHSQVVFDKFYQKHADYKNNYDRRQPEVEYDATKYKFLTRVYRYWVKNQWGGEMTNPHASAGVEPTNLISPEAPFYNYGTQIIEQSSDSMPGYVPGSSTDGNTVNVRFDKQNVEYYARVNFSKPTTITEDEYYYVVVEVEHQNHNTSYFCSQLVADNAEYVTLTIQNKDNKNLKKSDNTTDHYTGNEPSTKVRLFKATQDSNLGNLLAGTNCTEIKAGDFAKAQKVEFKDKEKNNPDKATTVYTEIIDLVGINDSDNYNYKDILGSGIAFGITADRFVQHAHAQTNFAANYFKDKADNIDVDLSSPSAGEIYIANFVTFEDPTDLTAEAYNPDSADDKTGRVVVGDPKGMVLNVNVPDPNRVKLHKPDLAAANIINVNTVSADTITNNVIDPTLQQMQAMSNLFAGKQANISPVITDSHFVVDTRDYADDATVYVDGDALEEARISNSTIFKFIKKENQTIVINYTRTKKVTVSEYNLEVIPADGGEVMTGDASPDGTRGSDQNEWLDKQVMRKIVWNLNSVECTDDEFKANEPCVSIRNTAGIFLIPNEKTVTHVESTSSGWLVSAGYVENTGAAEWHFPYSELEPFEAPKTTPVVVSKKAITGEEEIKGATLQIVDKVTGKNVGDAIWQYLAEKANTGVTALTTDIGESKDVRYGIQWTSGDAPKTIVLRDGSYTLKEFGDEFVTDGITYKVVTSSFDFEITNGVVSKVSKNVTEDNGSITYTAKNGTTPDTITVRDASNAVTTDLVIDKRDITGENEVAGAKLEIYKQNDAGEYKLLTSWTSGQASDNGKSAHTVSLTEGSYYLKESGLEGQAAGKYTIINSIVHFTVDANGITVDTNDIKGRPDASSKEGYYLYNERNNTITVCNAEKPAEINIDKTDISGQTEIAGAKLSLFTDERCTVRAKDADGNEIEEWESDGRSAKKFALPNGTYYLKETGGELTIGEKINKVTESVLEFTVANGSVSIPAQDCLKASADETSDEGYFLYDADSNTIKVCNAERKPNVKIDKTDITGQTEIAGAKLSLFTDERCTTAAKDAFGNEIAEWTSDGRAAKEFILNDGTYYLKETGSEFKIGDTVYKVVPSVAEFTVTNGKVSVPAQDSVKTSPDNSNTEGYFLYDSSSETIKVCDAAVGKATVSVIKNGPAADRIDGAEFIITDETGAQVGEALAPSKTQAATADLREGKYFLVETKAPAGYAANDIRIPFEVKADGTVTADIPATYDSGYEFNDRTFTFTVKNEYQKRDLTFSKQDASSSEEIEGAKLTISEVTDSGDKTVASWTSGSDGKDRSGKLNPHVIRNTFVMDTVYKLVEETAPDGYLVAETIFFKLDANGNVSTSKTAGGTFTKLDGSTVVMKDAPTSVTIVKQDLNGKELTGAIFEITATGADAETVDLSETASKEIKGLKTGVVYKLHEVKAPENYTASDDIYFYINEDGSVVYGKTESVGEMEEAKENEIVVLNSKTTNLTISKKDISGQTEIAGATLGIYTDKECTKLAKDAGGDEIAVWTSQADTSKNVTLADGTYYLKESGDSTDAAGGYFEQGGVKYRVISSVLEFTVEDGKLVKAENAEDAFDENASEGYFRADKSNNAIYVCDAVIEPDKAVVKLTKTDMDGEFVAGATFTLVSDDGSTNISWTSSETEKVKSFELADGSYTITETEAAKGYDKIERTLEFTIKDGKIDDFNANQDAMLDADGGKYTYDADEILFTSMNKLKTYSISIKKIDSFRVAVEGAVLRVNDSDGSPLVEIIETDAEGKASVDDTFVMNKEYTLVETNPPKGYLPAESISFKFDEDGNLWTKQGRGDYEKQTSNEITMVDENSSIKISKFEITGKTEISNAKLVVYESDKTTIAKDTDGNTLSWTSVAGTVKEFVLNDGTYYLAETGDTFEFGGNTYKVTDSMLAFSVVNGKLQLEAQDSLKTALAQAGTEEGYYYYDETTGTIKVCDAEKTAKPATVKISKKAIGGEDELAGAKLSIFTDENKTTRAKDAEGNEIAEWTSGNEAKEFTLAEGTYYLYETGDKFTGKVDGKDVEFKVIPSFLKFTVDDQGNVTADIDANADKTNNGNGYFEQDSADSKHFIVSDAYTVIPKPATVKISKKAIGGEDELAGAKLSIFTDENKTTRAKDAEGNEIAEWTSGSEAKEFTLAEGTYYLYETGDKFTGKVDGKDVEFKVIPSFLKFTVDDQGNVTADIDANADKTNNGNGYFEQDSADSKHFIVSDAYTVIPKPATVKISKKAIGGEEELAGAKLSIFTDENKTTRAKDAEGNEIAEWTSGNEAKEFTLAEGTYYLYETGDKFTGKVDGKDVEFKVIPSFLKFTVDDQGNVTADIDANADKTNNGNGYFEQDSADSKHFIVSDAYTVIPKPATVKISKKAIGGEEELAGAKLSIYTDENKTTRAKDAEGNEIAEWTSGNEAKEFTLAEGTYYLYETGDKFTGKVDGKDVEFKVIPSFLKFTVDDQGNVTADIDANADKTNNGNGYFEQDSADSKHFIVSDAYTEITPPAPATTPVKISKKAVGGEEELPGAKLSIFTDKECTEKAKDAEGNTIEEWESGSEAKEFTLTEGNYYLKETGDKFTGKVNGKDVEFKVITSVLNFKINDKGEIEVVNKEVLETNENEGYFSIDAKDSDHFIVSDAYTEITPPAPKPATVKISKTEISGKTELAGAKLSIFTDKECTEKAKDDEGNTIEEWESGSEAKEFTLADGTYYLKETGDEFTVKVGEKETTYKVVTSVLEFTVEEGKIKVSAQDALKDQADENSEDGYFLFDSETGTITICDAEKSEDNPGNNSGDNPGNNSGDNPGNNGGDTPGNNGGDTPGNNGGDTPGNNGGDTPGNNGGDTPGNNGGDTPGNNGGDTPGNNGGDTPGNNGGDTPGNNGGDDTPPPTGSAGTKAGFLILFMAAAAVAGNKKRKR